MLFFFFPKIRTNGESNDSSGFDSVDGLITVYTKTTNSLNEFMYGGIN